MAAWIGYDFFLIVCFSCGFFCHAVMDCELAYSKMGHIKNCSCCLKAFAQLVNYLITNYMATVARHLFLF